MKKLILFILFLVIVLWLVYDAHSTTKYLLSVPIEASNGQPIRNGTFAIYDCTGTTKTADLYYESGSRYYYTTEVSAGWYDIKQQIGSNWYTHINNIWLVHGANFNASLDTLGQRIDSTRYYIFPWMENKMWKRENWAIPFDAPAFFWNRQFDQNINPVGSGNDRGFLVDSASTDQYGRDKIYCNDLKYMDTTWFRYPENSSETTPRWSFGQLNTTNDTWLRNGYRVMYYDPDSGLIILDSLDYQLQTNNYTPNAGSDRFRLNGDVLNWYLYSNIAGEDYMIDHDSADEEGKSIVGAPCVVKDDSSDIGYFMIYQAVDGVAGEFGRIYAAYAWASHPNGPWEKRDTLYTHKMLQDQVSDSLTWPDFLDPSAVIKWNGRWHMYLPVQDTVNNDTCYIIKVTAGNLRGPWRFESSGSGDYGEVFKGTSDTTMHIIREVSSVVYNNAIYLYVSSKTKALKYRANLLESIDGGDSFYVKIYNPLGQPTSGWMHGSGNYLFQSVGGHEMFSYEGRIRLLSGAYGPYAAGGRSFGFFTFSQGMDTVYSYYANPVLKTRMWYNSSSDPALEWGAFGGPSWFYEDGVAYLYFQHNQRLANNTYRISLMYRAFYKARY